MEGIAGIVYPDVFQVNHLASPMLDTMKHRGNSKREMYLFKNMQVGIVGGNFAFNDDRSICVGLNGSLYDTELLYSDLKKHGFVVSHTASHAEWIVHAYKLWGTGLLSRLNGDFAFFILDEQKERLILARDRVGTKPLYWYQDSHYFIFASELKALLATGCVPQTPSADALSSYLFFGYFPQDMTPIKDVNKLLPGYYLQFNRDLSIVIRSYWSYSSYFEKGTSSSKYTPVKHLDELIVNSVKTRLTPHKPMGCFISGGLGSACIAHYVNELKENRPLYGYTAGYEGQNEADVLAAKAVAKTLGIPHSIEMITPDNFLDNLVEIAWYLDEPLADPNVISLWRMAEKATEKTNKVFSGMGSDELFAGHSRYSLEEIKFSWSSQMQKKLIQAFGKVAIPPLNYIHPAWAYLLLKKSRTNAWQFDYLRQNAIFNEKNLQRASPKLGKLFDPEVFLHKFHNLSRIQSTVSSFLYFDVKTRLADCFILQLERLTAAQKLDWSPPFLDRHILEYLAGLPEPDQLSEKDTALYLKALLQDVFPPSIVDRPKRTRRDFLKTWVHHPKLASLLTMLTKGTLVETGLISESWLLVQLETPQTREAHFKELWALLMLEIWFKLYINRPIQAPPVSLEVKELLLET